MLEIKLYSHILVKMYGISDLIEYGGIQLIPQKESDDKWRIASKQSTIFRNAPAVVQLARLKRR